MIVFLDEIRIKLAHYIAVILARKKITPNQITVSRFILSVLVSLFFFTKENYLYNLLGLIFYVLLSIFDFVDGDVARLTKKTSALGEWLDVTSDYILMMIIIASLFFGRAKNGQEWYFLAILFFSSYSLLGGLISYFDNKYSLEVHQYEKIEEKMLGLTPRLKFWDNFLISFFNVHRSSLSSFCFCLSYPLFIGIIINQLWLTFAFITLMLILRSLGILVIMYLTFHKGKTNLALVKVLREYSFR